MFDEQFQWLASVITDTSTASSMTEFMTEKEYKGSAYGFISSPTSFSLNEKKVIGTIASSNENSVHVRSDIETEEDLTVVTNYEKAFVVNLIIK